MSSLRFSRSLRLTENREIQTVFQKGRKLTSPFLAIFSLKNNLDHPRLCVSVSKKQIPQAVIRHKIKRIARESFRVLQQELPDCDLVIIIYKSMRQFDSKLIREKLDQQWQRLLAISNKSPAKS